MLAGKGAENGSADEDELGAPNGLDEDEDDEDDEKGEEEEEDEGGGMWREPPDEGGGGSSPMPPPKAAPPVGCGRCVGAAARAPSASSPAFPLIFLVCTHDM